MESKLEILGAKENNLKNINLDIPLNKFVVFTGLSGSGKSSLAFNTIFAEGQRRFLETYSTYVKQFVGGLERPKVDKIKGLNPVISIEQKTVSKSPRSTVGTITEIYDFLRLLYSRTSTAYSMHTGKKMQKRSLKQIQKLVHDDYSHQKIYILASKVSGRKGHYKELFETILKAGYTKVFIDGELRNISEGLKLDRYKIHDIDIVIDRLEVKAENTTRLNSSIELALSEGNGSFKVGNSNLSETKFYSSKYVCEQTGISYPDPEPNLFSFNSPYGACKNCNGLGEISELDLDKIIPDPKKSIKSGGILPLGEYKNNWFFEKISRFLNTHNFRLNTPIHNIDPEIIKVLIYGNEDLEDNQDTTKQMKFEGISNYLLRSDYKTNNLDSWSQDFLNKTTCSVCSGFRINEIALHFKIAEKHIGEVANFDIPALISWIDSLNYKLNESELKIAFEIIKELKSRAAFIMQVGLNYLQLNRPSKSLSGGESQRIRLASQIGTNLVNVLYILDEPSIGLHSRDNSKLIDSLRSLKEKGNSIIVVEHDREIIENADFLVEIGPNAGKTGGYITASGKLEDFLKQDCITSDYLFNKKSIKYNAQKRKGNGKFLELKGASGNNLKNINIKLPLGTLICVTGVSGSGKSTLINQTLYPILKNHFFFSTIRPLPYKGLEGIENIDKVIEIDQKPIGRTPRSNPSTYTKVFDEIRKLFAELPDSQIRGYKPGRFSFNISGGRCESCTGGGKKLIEMNFLPDVYIDCEECMGFRYNKETLEVKFKGKNISEILNLSIAEATDFFSQIPKIQRILQTLKNVGLGYLTLGQSSTTLSGGEAQRIKLASELAKKSTGKTLFLLDEPSTGLHFEDIKMLLNVLQELVDEGNTVLIIEHNLDIIKVSDYLIDLGPDGGLNGGNICAAGNTHELIYSSKKQSSTLEYLRKEVKGIN